MSSKRLISAVLGLVCGGLMASVRAQGAEEEGIPVTDNLVIEKCSPCHTRDAKGNLTRISWKRDHAGGLFLFVAITRS